MRYLGYNFNPISLFYCCDASGKLEIILAEVRNTFGESHNYWLHPGNAAGSANARHHRVSKQMHVSPFMDMGLDYQFVLTDPGEHLTAHMNTLDGGRPTFDATLTLRREPWNARSLHRALAAHPWMTAKVIGAIHWEALRLWIKRVPVYTHPARRSRNA
jgi:DUF1365 family protein